MIFTSDAGGFTNWIKLSDIEYTYDYFQRLVPDEENFI